MRPRAHYTRAAAAADRPEVRFASYMHTIQLYYYIYRVYIYERELNARFYSTKQNSRPSGTIAFILYVFSAFIRSLAYKLLPSKTGLSIYYINSCNTHTIYSIIVTIQHYFLLSSIASYRCYCCCWVYVFVIYPLV